MWKSLKLLLPSSKSSAPFKLLHNNQVFTCKKTIANIFNQFFVTIASKLSSNLPPVDLTKLPSHRVVPPHVKFKFGFITEQFVSTEIEKMKCGKSTGLDQISVKLLKLAKPAITSHLTYIMICH